MLGLTFADPADYDLIQETDTFDILGLESFAAGVPLYYSSVHHAGRNEAIVLYR